jgi:hypothetical protein
MVVMNTSQVNLLNVPFADIKSTFSKSGAKFTFLKLDVNVDLQV